MLAGATAPQGLTLEKELVITRSKREMRALSTALSKQLKKPVTGLAAGRDKRIAKPSVMMSPELPVSKRRRLTKSEKKAHLKMLKEMCKQQRLEKKLSAAQPKQESEESKREDSVLVAREPVTPQAEASSS